MEESGVSPTTIKNARAILCRAINVALREGSGLISRNVAALARPPSQERYNARPLNEHEIPLFLAAAKDDRLLALWQDVDLDRIRLAVNVQI